MMVGRNNYRKCALVPLVHIYNAADEGQWCHRSMTVPAQCIAPHGAIHIWHCNQSVVLTHAKQACLLIFLATSE